LDFIDPKELGLSSRIKIGRRSDKELYIVIDRKSRIIMRDGERIEKIVSSIKKINPGTNVALATSAAVCSKTKAYLAMLKISIKQFKTN
jgi:hypothetical protein